MLALLISHLVDLGTHILLQAFSLPSPCHVWKLPRHLQEHAITSDHALSLPMMPKRIVIVGAGYIAVEFSGIFNGMGADVSSWGLTQGSSRSSGEHSSYPD